MSDGNRGDAHPTFFIIVGLALAFIVGYGIWGLSALHTKESIAASQRASQYSKDTEQQILEACLVPELAAMRECVTEKVKASEENQRASYDLVAQNDVARWTFWMLVLGLAGTALTLIGVYYLRANLDEMQSQTRDNRLIGEAQVAAHLQFVEADFSGSADLLQLRILVKNSGLSLARIVFGKAQLHVTVLSYNMFDPDPEARWTSDEFTSEEVYASVGTLSIGSEDWLTFWFHSTTDKGLVQQALALQNYFSVEVKVKWFDVFGKPREANFTLSDAPKPWPSDQPTMAGNPILKSGRLYVRQKN